MVQKPNRLTVLALLLCGAVSAALVWQVAVLAREFAFDQIEDRGRNTLNLVVENLRGDLAKYRYLPRILSMDPTLRMSLETPDLVAATQQANLELSRVSLVSGASDVYLMDPTGLTVAASNWDSDKPFVGRNFRFRPYFQQAMNGQLGRYFALGTTSGERGYFFAHPIRRSPNANGAPIVGVVVVKMAVGHHELNWATPDSDVMVVDKDGVVFMSSRPEWLYRTLDTLPPARLEEIGKSFRYTDKKLVPLQAEITAGEIAERGFMRISDDGRAARGAVEDFMLLQEEMIDAGWRVILLSRTDAVQGQVQNSLAVASAVLLSIALAGVAVYQRRKRLAERIAMQERAKSHLEDRVRERTEDLTRANEDLHREILERKRAEKTVRETQASLVQATKLAALGQMSAGLSHELNQPLAAIRSYADNAKGFLDRGRTDNTARNLGEISSLTERMARIIRNLRTYSRDEPTDLRPVPVQGAVEEALTLLGQRIEAEGVIVNRQMAGHDLFIEAGTVRLQQVFVNLLTNALDAMSDMPERKIEIGVREGMGGQSVVVELTDSGHGFSGDQAEKVFDPFFSTKEVGKGMGLGLSITFGLVNQFGGTISAANSPDGGALFSLQFPRAAPPVEAVA